MKMNLTPAQQQRADKLARMTSAEWDAVCKRCGMCCLIKLRVVPGTPPLYLKRCCDKFNTTTRRCMIYQTRSANPCCNKVTMDNILSGDLLPASCGYVEYIFGPAPFKPNMDFSRVYPISDDDVENISPDQVNQDKIAESVLWSMRRSR